MSGHNCGLIKYCNQMYVVLLKKILITCLGRHQLPYGKRKQRRKMSTLFPLFSSRTTDYQEECSGKAHLRLCYCRLLSFAVTSRGLQHACSMNVQVSQYAKWLLNILTSLKYKVFTVFTSILNFVRIGPKNKFSIYYAPRQSSC